MNLSRRICFNTVRSYSHKSGNSAHPDHLSHPAFSDLETSLAPLPCFRTRAESCVKVLYEPQEFYQRLLVS